MFIPVLLTAFASVLVHSENVATLTTENFHKTIADNEYVLAEFYAPWVSPYYLPFPLLTLAESVDIAKLLLLNMKQRLLN
jgi:hypothetical protein